MGRPLERHAALPPSNFQRPSCERRAPVRGPIHCKVDKVDGPSLEQEEAKHGRQQHGAASHHSDLQTGAVGAANKAGVCS